MDIKKFLKEKDEQRQKNGYLAFTVDELSAIKADEVEHVVEFFHGYTLMKLPQTEVDFFEWLKKNDKNIWNDLWDDDIDLYQVSVDFLRQLAGKNPQFPICDLLEEDNYWFCRRHIKPKGMEQLEEILLKIDGGLELSAAELFLFELTNGTTDIWHFSYQHDLDMQEMKQLVSDMVYKGWIVHLPKREDLVKYIEM